MSVLLRSWGRFPSLASRFSSRVSPIHQHLLPGKRLGMETFGKDFHGTLALNKVNGRYGYERTTTGAISNGVRLLTTGKPRKEEEDDQWARQEPVNRGRTMAALATAGVFLLGKGKYVLGALKFAKFGPLLSMVASVGAYSFFFGWPFAVGMVGLIGIHEAGHFAVMKYYNIPTGPTVFLPFIGAYVEMKDMPRDVGQEAMVALGGPVVGGAASLALSFAGVYTDSQLLIALADFGLIINLFNLLPIGTLDGGRIGNAISPYFLVGGLGLGGMMIYHGLVSSPLFYLVMIMGGFTTFQRFQEGTHESYYRIPRGQKIGIFALYLSLIMGLLAAQAINNKHKKSVQQLREEQPVEERKHSEFGQKFEQFAAEWADDSVDHDQALSAQEQQFFQSYFGENGSNSSNNDDTRF